MSHVLLKKARKYSDWPTKTSKRFLLESVTCNTNKISHWSYDSSDSENELDLAQGDDFIKKVKKIKARLFKFWQVYINY